MPELVWSASQLEKLASCEERWWFIYKLGRREPQTDATTAGGKVHALLEAYLRDGAPIDESITWKKFEIGRIAADMARHLPPPGTVKNVEETYNVEINGHKYTLRIDADTESTVYDHKTTGQLKRAKTEDKLKEDIQATLYARWADRDVTLQWTTGQSKGAIKSKAIKLRVLKSEAEERFERLVQPLADRAKYLHSCQTKPKDIKKNYEACRLYPPHGCPFKDDCLTPGERLRTHMSAEKKQTLAEKLAARKNGAQSAPVAETVAPERAAAVAADIAAIAEAQASMKLDRETRVAEDLINPPLVTHTGAPAEPITTETAVLPKKTRKRKEVSAETEANFKALQEALDGKRPMENPEELRQKMVESLVRDSLADRPIRTLFINCLPLESRSGLLYAHELIAKAAETVQNDAQVPHVKLIDFGKGGGALAAQLAADIKAMGGGFDLVLMAKNPEGRDCESTLCGLAQNVIMGV